MKKLYTLFVAVLLTAVTFGQSPEKMSYQAILRAADGTLVVEQLVGMQISILQGGANGTAVYTETQTPTTNTNGLVTLELGTGATADDFSSIDWSNDTYFVKTETDLMGGTNFTLSGTSALLSVPYALYANYAGNSLTAQQASDIVSNTAKVGYTEALVSANTDVAANTAKVGYTEVLVSANPAVAANTSKVGITTQQASDIVSNTAKVGYTEALVSANTDVVANTAKVGYTEALVSANPAVAANTLKVGITAQQASDIASNNDKVSITTDQANAIAANTDKVGITANQATAITSNTDKVGMSAGTATGEMNYYNGTAWVVITPSVNEGATLQLIDGVPTWTGGTPPPVIGELSDGGIVFYVAPTPTDLDGDGDLDKGLVCATSDSEFNSITWGCYGTEIIGANGTAIGSGAQNMIDILAGCTTTGTAADLCANLIFAGYSDWFLPSKDELNLMYQNIGQGNALGLGNLASFSDSFYWSSSEYFYDTKAWGVYFNSGNLGEFSKNLPNTVRAVRAY